jgi:hypothetical protein
MRGGLRIVLLAFIGAVVLAASPAAMGDESSYQFVVPGVCGAFAIESVSGSVSSCISSPDGVGRADDGYYSAAANDSVVFSDTNNSEYDAGGAIWIVSPNSGPTAELDSSPYDYNPSISYDGSKVVFARYDPATGSSDIYSVNSDGSDLTEVISGQGVNYLRDPVISPDGSSIAYWCGPAANGDTSATSCGPLTDGSYRYAGVMRANIDGTRQRMIVIGPGGNLEPVGPTGFAWSPDSQWIAMDGLLNVYLGNDEWTAQRELFEYHTDGSDLFDNLDPTRQVTQFTYDPNAAHPNIPIFPQFSPDGSQLLYMDFFDGSGNQGNFSYLIGTDGSDPHQIYLNPNVDCHDGSCYGGSYGAFIPTATPTSPPPLVDMTHITVPAVTKLKVATAKSTLTAVNLTVGTVSNNYSTTVAKGAVISQSPSAGTVAHRTVKIGPSVNLVVSKGVAPPMTLTVVRSGTGFGKVTSQSSGISCGSTCSHAYAYNASVTLTATPAVGSKFVGWSGACSGTGVCHVTMSAAKSVTARFALLRTLKVTKAGSGSGTVVSTIPGISCGATCSYGFVFGVKVTLTAKPATGSKFVGWSGACSGTGVCRVTMNAARSVTATFRKTSGMSRRR